MVCSAGEVCIGWTYSIVRAAHRSDATSVHRPGELLHLDVKKLGRIPPGGGHRIHGDRTRRGRRIGHDFIHVAIDDHSRWAFVQVHPDERGETAASFLRAAAAHFAELGIRIERVMTDNAKGYVESRAFQAVLAKIGATHKRTRPYRPQTNGEAEAFIWTLQREWAYARGLHLERLEAPDAPRLRRHLQSPATSHRARRAPADLPGCRQRERELHLVTG